ncbi:MAG: hypothetical protein PHF19_01695 [Synergistales bacterium]|nr:hypothetical protein [Synergistales bacterium]
MNKPLLWVIDVEWPDDDVEKELLRGAFLEVEIRFSGNDYGDDLADFGWKADGILCQIDVDMPGEDDRASRAVSDHLPSSPFP